MNKFNSEKNQKFKIQMMRWSFCIENKVTIFEEQKKSFIILIILTKKVKLNIFTEDVKICLKFFYFGKNEKCYEREKNNSSWKKHSFYEGRNQNYSRSETDVETLRQINAKKN